MDELRNLVNLQTTNLRHYNEKNHDLLYSASPKGV